MLGKKKDGSEFEYKKVFYHHIAVPEDQLRCLDLCEYFQSSFTLNGMEFNYFIKRNAESKFEFVIQNPHKVEIRKRGEHGGTTEDFEEEVTYKGANFHFAFLIPN
uniref:Uncharacterized protein n=1 Tax=Panagrolaimus davidi TaxID=227884 RepID=A0A914PGU6_9BILA